MNERTILLEVLLAGFFAVACIKCWVPAEADGKVGFDSFLRFPDRWERLQRSRWQWVSMVLLMLVLRVQHELPLILEVTAVFQFALFVALPAVHPATANPRRKEAAAAKSH